MSQTPEMPAISDERLQLRVKTSDAQSDIVVLDAKGRFLQRGCGPEHTFDLERGIYRVKVLTGTESQEKPVVLTEPLREPVQFPPVAFASPVPLVGTSTSHEYHLDAATKQSQKTHVAHGAGSSLFFLVRDWTPNQKLDARKRITASPATGLSLHAVRNGIDTKVADLAAASTTNLDLDAWSACTIDLDPGVYELRLDLPAGGRLNQSIVASPGWQTQSFIFMRGYPVGKSEESTSATEWRADLACASVLLARHKGFWYAEPLLRLTELARVALATRRRGEQSKPTERLLPEELRTLLREKLENPMLGIYGGHLLLLEASPDFTLLREVVQNLRALLGAPHPDAEALALRTELGTSVAPFEHPPMLRRSWSLIVEASVTRPELVTEALADRPTSEISSEGSWCIWQTPSEDDAARQDQADLSDVEEALAEDLGVMKHVRRARRAEVTRASRGIVANAPQLESLGLPEAAGRAASAGIDEGGMAGSGGAPREVTVEIAPDHLRSIARRFGLPQNQLQRVLSTLEDKLGRMDAAPGLKVTVKRPTTRE